MPEVLNVFSEVGRLRKVLVHRPGSELLNLSPDNLGALLFDDIPYLRCAQQEHDAFVRILTEEGVEVVYLDKLVAEAICAHPGARAKFIEEWLDESGIDGSGVREAVRERMEAIDDALKLVDKAIEGVRADEIDLANCPATSLADLMAAGADAASPLVADPIPNLYFTRDTFTVIGHGVAIHSMRSRTRRREGLFAHTIFSHHPDYAGVPQWSEPGARAHMEGGDILVLGADVLAVGVTERTQPAAVDRLATSLLWGEPDSQIRRIFVFSIPHKRSFMHLDTVFTQVDVDAFTVHPAILGTLRAFEVTRGTHTGEVSIRALEESLATILGRALGLGSVRLIKCGGADPIASAREQWNDGSNTFAVRPGRVLVYQRNAVTNEILYREGLELLEVPSAELSRGRGGPHCMTMPLRRDEP